MTVSMYSTPGLRRATSIVFVCTELQRRGYHAIHGDRELAYQDHAITFFCGGSRNSAKFIDLFDGVFVLEVDLATLNRRLDERPASEWGGEKPPERELILRLHQTREDIPKNGISIDATAPLARVVDEILRQSEPETDRNPGIRPKR
jgi:hypothetical protein